MYGRRLSLVAIAFAGLLLARGAGAQELDGRIKAGSPSQSIILKDDTEGDARTVGTLHGGDAVTVYLQISSNTHYFIKLKSSKPGEGSGWVPRSKVQLSLSEADAKPANDAKSEAAKLDAAMGAPPQQAAETESDIPPGHWARAAVEDLARIGLLKIPGGKFEGEHTVNRYEMALLTQRVVKHSGQSSAQLAGELARVSKTGKETRGQLEKVAARLAEVEKKVATAAPAANTAAGNTTSPVPSDVLKDLGREVNGLRQTFTRSIASLAMDRSKIEEYRSAWSEIVTRLERIEKKLGES